MSIRGTRTITQAQPTREGAGVNLHRAFGFGKSSDFDPFLLLDDFRGDSPKDWQAGFPWHPHRGIETITYILAGEVEHADSLGNRGTLGAGDIQWMTAGSGIIHQEMPKGDERGRVHGFQLWANLPAKHKMVAPRYQDIRSTAIPEVVDDDGSIVRVICGNFWGQSGPVEGIAADPNYLDISVAPNQTRTFPVSVDRHAFAYVFTGDGKFHGASSPLPVAHESLDGLETKYYSQAGNRSLVLFDSGDEIRVTAGPEGMRFLLASGRPLGEPVAWHGPIVMNTPIEIRQALRDLDQGTFLKG